MSDRTTAVAEPESLNVPLARETQSCPPHHFVVESPHGDAVSAASCRKCGERREYRNWLEQYDYIGSSWKRNAS